MTPEQIARRFDDLYGFDLVDYAEAALPLWQLGTEAISIAHKKLQPIKEFCLRAIEAGLKDTELSGFLGLDEAVIRGALADLASERLIILGDDIRVTDFGRKALAEGQDYPTQEQLTLLFDGILRKPIAAEPSELAWPRDIEDGSVVEIPALPPDRPTVSDLTLAEVDEVLREAAGGRHELGRDILKLKRINRYRRLFRRGVALVFKAKKSNELRLFFVINAVRDENLERRFAEAGGTARKGFVRAFSDSYLSANLRRHLGTEVTRRVLEQSEYAARQRTLSIAKLRVATLTRKAAMAARGELSPGDAPNEEIIAEAHAAERSATLSLENAAARPAAVYEKNEFLARAIESAQKTISISTKGLAPHVVDQTLINALARKVESGVELIVSINEDGKKWQTRGGKWEAALIGIEKLERLPNAKVHLRVTSEERYYHIAWDDHFALVCNRPILSNPGRTRSFEQFAGYVLQDPSLISAYLARVNR